MTIKDADGREWVLVPKDGDWNMTKAALALITSSNINTGDLKIGTLAAAFENAIAAAPQFVPPAAQGVEVSDLSHDESWLSQVHAICNDAGIPAGHVVSRVKQLRAQLDELTELIEYCKARKRDAAPELVEALRMVVAADAAEDWSRAVDYARAALAKAGVK